MREERNRILDLLEQGKITAEDARRLLDALDGQAASVSEQDRRGTAKPRFLRVVVAEGSATLDQPTVNIRVPLQLLRAGVRLKSLLPEHARHSVSGALGEKGISFDLNDFKPEMVDELVDSLAELSLEVNDKDDRVRIFCE